MTNFWERDLPWPWGNQRISRGLLSPVLDSMDPGKTIAAGRSDESAPFVGMPGRADDRWPNFTAGNNWVFPNWSSSSNRGAAFRSNADQLLADANHAHEFVRWFFGRPSTEPPPLEVPPDLQTPIEPRSRQRGKKPSDIIESELPPLGPPVYNEWDKMSPFREDLTVDPGILRPFPDERWKDRDLDRYMDNPERFLRDVFST